MQNMPNENCEREDKVSDGCRIRVAALEDVPTLVRMHASAGPLPDRRLSETEIRGLIEHFEAGQLVLCDALGCIIGSLHAKRSDSVDIGSDDALMLHETLALRCKAGPSWELLSINLGAGCAMCSVGAVLLTFAITYALQTHEVQKVVFAAPSFISKEEEMTHPAGPLLSTEGRERGNKAGLAFYVALGAAISYDCARWPADTDRKGVDIIIEYNLLGFRQISQKPLSSRAGCSRSSDIGRFHRQNEPDVDLQQMSCKIIEVVNNFFEAEVGADCPLLEAGLDSSSMQRFVQATCEVHCTLWQCVVLNSSTCN